MASREEAEEHPAEGRLGLDLRDIVTLVGTALLAGGLYLIWPPAALIVPGILFVYIGVWHGAAKQP